MEVINPVYLFVVAFIVIIMGIVVIQESGDNIEALATPEEVPIINNFSSSTTHFGGNGSTQTLSPIEEGINNNNVSRYNNTWLRFNLSTQSVSGMPRYNVSKDGANISVFAWVNISGEIPVGTYTLFGGTSSNLFGFSFNETYLILTWRNNTPTIASLTYDINNLNDSQWHYIGYTFNANSSGNLSIYVDSEIVNTSNMGDAQTVEWPFTIGRYIAGDTGNFSIDEFRRYNGTVLTPSDVSLLYNNGRVCNTSLLMLDNLYAYYCMNENSGNNLYDLSSYNTNATKPSTTGWFFEDVNISITENIDYTLNNTSGLFTLLNPSVSWSPLNINWEYFNTTTFDLPADNINLSTARLINVFLALAILTFIFLIIKYYYKDF